ncbi:uncharacterized protein LOC108733651 isoform X2 [Agrilus planipennis]|uniref:Uncharacterized protein LOC108733651 isoform X2 n=1 Tax=Agrilus planipennis TaxID=224129 RepID=A0A1W4W8L6_AGRPL|nr:uncharacterized protein LOC108733651 isoform X2 [Agrilus planipennis]
MEQEKELPLGATAGPSTDSQDSTRQKGIEENPQPPSPNALKVAATECLNNWICYLQILNSLCTAGLRLSQSLHNLSQFQNVLLATQCQGSWEEFVKAASFATNTVKNHIASAMQDMIIGETFTDDDAQRQQEHNQQIITENLHTFINLQYQFSLAGCEIFGVMASCPSCHSAPGIQHVPDCSMATLQHCFSQIYAQETRSQTSSPHNTSADRNVGMLDSPKGPELSKFYGTGPEFSRQHSPINANPEPRSTSPFHETFRGSSPDTIKSTSHIETIRGPFPNPGHLYTMKSPFPGRGSRSALHFPLFPLIGQRRWSEAAAATSVGESGAEGGDGSMRRWSMPWDCGRVETAPWQQRYLPTKLTVPVAGTSQERSRSNTPETLPNQPGTLPGGEGLAEAIQLLSCRPMRCSIPFAHTPHPGPYGTSVWTDTHEDRMHKRGHGGPLQSIFSKGHMAINRCSSQLLCSKYRTFRYFSARASFNVT